MARSTTSTNSASCPTKLRLNVVLADTGGVAEAASNGTVVSILSGVDVNVGTGDSLTYTLVDDADGRFALQGDTLIVADGLRLDFEQSQSHTVKVVATDKDGLSVERVLTVQVVDVLNENISASAAADHLVGGGGADIFRGLGGEDVLAGGAGNDTLDGGAGKDTLDGGAGADRMDGGSGDDIYYIDSAFTWASQGQDGDQEGIFQQRFDFNGNAAWPTDKPVNVTAVSRQDLPKVTSLADGGWVVSWMSEDDSQSGIYQQYFNKDGVAASPARSSRQHDDGIQPV